MTYNKEEKELIDILTINELYTITSKKTGYIHMDADRCCYLFTAYDTAEGFSKNKPDLNISKSGYVVPMDLLALLYRYGFTKIAINDNKIYDLHEKYGYRYFCNTSLNASIFLIKEMKKKCYLYSLAGCNYLLPVQVKNFEREVPEILYPTAKKKETQVFLPVFSDLEEYAQWDLHEKWSPVLMDFNQVVKYAAKDGIIINPSSNRLTISWEKINIIQKNYAAR